MIERDTCVIIFIKYPDKGKVKTRLAEDIGRKVSSELYRRFVEDILDTLMDIETEKLIFFFPESRREKFINWLGDGYMYYSQTGNNLGERMKNAFVFGFKEGYKSIIIIGSDSPDLPERIITNALNVLANKDAVLGPSHDGGYYLIGFSKSGFNAGIFEGISWSTNTVYRKTVDILKKENTSVHILPSWRDVDTFEDLKVFFRNNRNKNIRAITYLKDKEL